MQKFISIMVLVLMSAILLSAQNTVWQTTHNGTSQGSCRLESNSFKVYIHALHLDVEEEATISTTGTVGWGDSSTLEITGTFQVSPGTAVRSMLLWNGETLLKAKLRDRNKADSAYEDVVDRSKPVFVSRDPALIEYLGNNQYRYKIYPVAINQSRRIRILYTIPLSPYNQSMAFALQPAFTHGPTAGAPTQIPIEIQIDTSNHQHYLLECNNKKRDVQPGSTYLLSFADMRYYYWSMPSVKILRDSLTKPQAYLHTIDTGNGCGTYIALFAPVPYGVIEAIQNENISNYTIEAAVSSGNKQYVVEVTNKPTIASYIKTAADWNRMIAWNAYDADGRKIFSTTDTFPVDTTSSDLTMLPLIWGAKYSLKEGSGNLGATYGFVDRTMSLLALESDSLRQSDAEEWRDGGVPPLKPEEIIVDPEDLPNSPDENILFEFGTGTIKAIADHSRVFTFSVLPNGQVLISSSILLASRGYTVCLFDLRGKLLFRQKGTIASNGRLMLQLPQRCRGTYLIRVQTEGQRLQRMITLR